MASRTNNATANLKEKSQSDQIEKEKTDNGEELSSIEKDAVAAFLLPAALSSLSSSSSSSSASSHISSSFPSSASSSSSMSNNSLNGEEKMKKKIDKEGNFIKESAVEKLSNRQPPSLLSSEKGNNQTKKEKDAGDRNGSLNSFSSHEILNLHPFEILHADSDEKLHEVLENYMKKERSKSFANIDTQQTTQNATNENERVEKTFKLKRDIKSEGPPAALLTTTKSSSALPPPPPPHTTQKSTLSSSLSSSASSKDCNILHTQNDDANFSSRNTVNVHEKQEKITQNEKTHQEEKARKKTNGIQEKEHEAKQTEENEKQKDIEKQNKRKEEKRKNEKEEIKRKKQENEKEERKEINAEKEKKENELKEKEKKGKEKDMQEIRQKVENNLRKEGLKQEKDIATEVYNHKDENDRTLMNNNNILPNNQSRTDPRSLPSFSSFRVSSSSSHTTRLFSSSSSPSGGLLSTIPSSSSSSLLSGVFSSSSSSSSSFSSFSSSSPSFSSSLSCLHIENLDERGSIMKVIVTHPQDSLEAPNPPRLGQSKHLLRDLIFLRRNRQKLSEGENEHAARSSSLKNAIENMQIVNFSEGKIFSKEEIQNENILVKNNKKYIPFEKAKAFIMDLVKQQFNDKLTYEGALNEIEERYRSLRDRTKMQHKRQVENLKNRLILQLKKQESASAASLKGGSFNLKNTNYDALFEDEETEEKKYKLLENYFLKELNLIDTQISKIKKTFFFFSSSCEGKKKTKNNFSLHNYFPKLTFNNHPSTRFSALHMFNNLNSFYNSNSLNDIYPHTNYNKHTQNEEFAKLLKNIKKDIECIYSQLCVCTEEEICLYTENLMYKIENEENNKQINKYKNLFKEYKNYLKMNADEKEKLQHLVQISEERQKQQQKVIVQNQASRAKEKLAINDKVDDREKNELKQKLKSAENELQVLLKEFEAFRDSAKKDEESKWRVLLNEKNEKIKKLENEISNLNEKLKEANQNEKNLNQQIQSVNRSLEIYEKQLGNIVELKKKNETLKDEKQQIEKLYKDEKYLRKKYYNEIEDMKGKIRVFCRVRPLMPYEVKKEGSTYTTEIIDEFSIAIQTNKGRKEFMYDRCFSPEDSQEEVFEEARRLVRSAVDGYNVCIFAYGQTGSGKTYTMKGTFSTPSGSASSSSVSFLEEKNAGIAPRAINELFVLLNKLDKNRFDYSVQCYMVELYNNQLSDLLLSHEQSAKPLPLEIKKDANNLVKIQNANIQNCSDAQQLFQLFCRGLETRHSASTLMNAESSRSHLIFSILINVEDKVAKKNTFGKLSLIDLAGSERLSKTGATDNRLTEAKEINKSLSALGDVIAALSNGDVYIPYRNSKLTQIMSDSLGGSAKTLMFVNISPSQYNLDESVMSLTYAARVKLITNDATKNVEGKDIVKLKKEIEKLQNEIEELKKQNSEK